MPPFRVGKPSWILGQSAAQVVAGGAAQDLFWDVVAWEDPTVFDGISGVEVDRPGLYLIGLHVTRAAVASSSPVTTRIRRNGATEVLNQTASTANAVSVPLLTMLKLDAGDVITGNVTLHATIAASTSAPSTELWGARVGPERWTG